MEIPAHISDALLDSLFAYAAERQAGAALLAGVLPMLPPIEIEIKKERRKGFINAMMRATYHIQATNIKGED